jgi:hypothetical protein
MTSSACLVASLLNPQHPRVEPASALVIQTGLRSRIAACSSVVFVCRTGHLPHVTHAASHVCAASTHRRSHGCAGRAEARCTFYQYLACPPGCTITAACQRNMVCIGTASHPTCVQTRPSPMLQLAEHDKNTITKIPVPTSRYAINKAAARSDGTTSMHLRPNPSAYSTQSRTHFAETAAIHFCSSFLSKCNSMPSTGMSCCWYFLSRCSRNCSNTFLRYT